MLSSAFPASSAVRLPSVHDVFRALASARARRRARRAFKAGELYRHPFQTPDGRLRSWATVGVEGSTLILSEIGIYPERQGETARSQIGLREMVRLRDEIAAKAALAGFERLRITAVRTDRIRDDGHPLVDVVVDLAPYRSS